MYNWGFSIKIIHFGYLTVSVTVWLCSCLHPPNNSIISINYSHQRFSFKHADLCPSLAAREVKLLISYMTSEWKDSEDWSDNSWPRFIAADERCVFVLHFYGVRLEENLGTEAPHHAVIKEDKWTITIRFQREAMILSTFRRSFLYRLNGSVVINPSSWMHPKLSTHFKPLRYSGQSFWLQIQGYRVRFPALPDFLRSSGSGTGSTQPRGDN
jgi:hypothetical protein